MGIVRTLRAARGTLAVLMLAPFLVGGNHCLIGAMQRDTHMRCLQMAPDAAPMPDHACCHSDQSSKGKHEQANTTSCCVLVGPVPADAQVPAPVSAVPCIAAADNVIQGATVADHEWPVAVFEEPPEAPPAASHSSRAPPLS